MKVTYSDIIEDSSLDFADRYNKIIKRWGGHSNSETPVEIALSAAKLYAAISSLECQVLTEGKE